MPLSEKSFIVKSCSLGVAAATLMLVAGPLAAQGAGDRVLTIASYGGAYTRSQIIAYVDPYRERSNQWVEVVNYGGGLDEVRDQVISLNVKWDVVDMSAADAIQACNDGLLEPLGGLTLPPAPQGTAAAEDFYDDMLLPCAIGQNIWATVIAYDTTAYEGRPAPSSLADLFDLQRFPGSRALQKSPRVNMEWALLADGVAPGEVYRLLETDAGVARALAVLERIRPAIIWWSDGEEPLDLLQRRRVAMASAWSGRIFFRNRSGGSLGTIWDGSVLEREYWVIPKGAPAAETGKTFIAFASDPERQAEQANQIGYSPARRSAKAMVAADVVPFTPTAPENARQGFASDAEWWARNFERLEDAFLDWADGRQPRRYGRTSGGD